MTGLSSPGVRVLSRRARIGLSRDRRAISALEYALLAMFVGLAVIGAETKLGLAVRNLFTNDTTPIVNVVNGLSTGGGSGGAPAPG